MVKVLSMTSRLKPNRTVSTDTAIVNTISPTHPSGWATEGTVISPPFAQGYHDCSASAPPSGEVSGRARFFAGWHVELHNGIPLLLMRHDEQGQAPIMKDPVGRHSYAPTDKDDAPE